MNPKTRNLPKKTKNLLLWALIILFGIGESLSLIDWSDAARMSCSIHVSVHNNSPFPKEITEKIMLPTNSTIQLPTGLQQEVLIERTISPSSRLLFDTNKNLLLVISDTFPPMNTTEYVVNMQLILRAGVVTSQTSRSFSEYNKTSPDYTMNIEAVEDIESDDPAIVTRATELNDTDPWKVGENVISFVASHLTYSLEGTGYGAAYSLESGMGRCYDYACLATALLRACSIPARYTSGLVLPEGFHDVTVVDTWNGNNEYNANSSLHAWVEYLIPGIGWVVSDPTWYDNLCGFQYLHGLDKIHITTFRGSPHSSIITRIADPFTGLEIVYEFKDIIGANVHQYPIIIFISIFGFCALGILITYDLITLKRAKKVAGP